MPGRQLSVALPERFSIYSPGAGHAIDVRIAVIQQFSRFISFLGPTGCEAASIAQRLGASLFYWLFATGGFGVTSSSELAEIVRRLADRMPCSSSVQSPSHNPSKTGAA
ncbi:hypothetical protein ACJJWD_19220 [Comamonas testosteroni]|uniref:hypothetical protein n=1 Tax=Comamonas testosteroni TaxID=285 RepID=UPI00389B284E